MLEQNCNKTLHGTKWRTVDHYRALAGIIAVYILQLKSFRKIIIDLDSTQLPAAAERITHHKVELRAVEGCFSVLNYCIQFFLCGNVYNGLFGYLPVFFRADILAAVILITKRNLGCIFCKTEGLEYI